MWINTFRFYYYSYMCVNYNLSAPAFLKKAKRL